MICSSEIKKSKQIGKQRHAGKQKRRLITQPIVYKVLTENLPPLDVENCQ